LGPEAGAGAGGAVAGFRHGAGAAVGVCIRVAVGLGVEEVAGQHTGRHLGVCGFKGAPSRVEGQQGCWQSFRATWLPLLTL